MKDAHQKRRYLSPGEKLAVVKRQDYRCKCGCGELLEAGSIRYDHILALHLGGNNSLDNFQALSVGHHQEKTDKESAARAKTKRIQAQGGLRKKKLSAKDKAMAKILRTA